MVGRIPSFIFYLGGLAALGLLLSSRRFLGLKNPFLVATVLLIPAFSLELRLMAAQMHSYAIGLLAACLIFGTTYFIRTGHIEKTTHLFLCGLILSVGVAMQYQGLFLLAACLGALLLAEIRERRGFGALRRYFPLGLSLAFGALLYFPFSIRHTTKGVTAMNAGPDQTFIVNGADYSTRFVDFLRLIYQESCYVVYNITTPVYLEGGGTVILGAFWLSVFLFGLFFLWRNRNERQGFSF